MGNNNSIARQKSAGSKKGRHFDAQPVQLQTTISNTATTTATTQSGHHMEKKHQNKKYSLAETHTRSNTIEEIKIYGDPSQLIYDNIGSGYEASRDVYPVGHEPNPTIIVNQYTEDITADTTAISNNIAIAMPIITEQFTNHSDIEKEPTQLSEYKSSPLSSPISKGVTDLTSIYSHGQYEEAIDHANTIDLSGIDSPSNSPPPMPTEILSERANQPQIATVQTMLNLNNDTNRSRKVETPLDVGEKIWVLSNNTHLWRECIIRDHKEIVCESSAKLAGVDVKKLQIRIHYISYSSFYDEWLDHNSPRISLQRPGGNKLHVGDNFSLYSQDYSSWLEAEVTAIDRDNQTVQVKLVSRGNPLEREWLSIHSPLISIKHKQSDEPAPILWNKSTKL